MDIQLYFSTACRTSSHEQGNLPHEQGNLPNESATRIFPRQFSALLLLHMYDYGRANN